jgi:hypothetical protein
LTLLTDICTFTAVPNSASDTFLQTCEEIRADFERGMSVKLDITPPEHHNIARVIPQVVTQALQLRSAELKAIDEALIDMRLKNHTCIVCRFHPAYYFADPCMHPCFCHGCLQRLTDVGGTFTPC